MCTGGQDIPVTLRVAGGVEGGKWKSSEDVRATPSPEEEVQTTETTETTEVPEPVGPSTPLYQPVIDRINKLSEKLPDEVADETVQEMQPMMHHGWGMNDKNHANTMQMLDRIMRNTRPRGPRPPRPGGPGKWGGGGGKGGGRGDPRKLHELVNPIRPQQTLGTQLGATQGLAGLFGGPQREQVMPQQGGAGPQMGTLMPARNPVHPFTGQWRGSMSQPMQPAVMEEQQMEILGQPKQFSSGGIVNALMATPIGQSAIREYAEGGDIKFGDYTFDLGLTGDDPLDILRGKKYDDGRLARWYASKKHMEDPSQPVVDWGRKEEEVEESPTLKSVRRILKPPKEEHQDSEGGSPPDPNRGFVGTGPGSANDISRGAATAVDTFSGIRGDPLGLASLLSGAMSQPGRTIGNFVTGFTPLGIPNLLSNIFGGPTIGDLFTSKSDLDKVLGEVAKAELGTETAHDLYGGNYDAAESMGLDYSGTDQPSVDVQSQVDTFSDINDQSMDSGDDDTGGTGDSDDPGGAHGGD